MQTTWRNLSTAALVLGATLALPACGARSGTTDASAPVDPAVTPHPPSGAPTAEDRKCRHRWVELVQLHGENGNPGGSQRALRDRWQRIDTQAEAFAKQASAVDCGATHADLRTRWGGLERLQYDLHDVDLPHQLELLEGDRRHYLDFNDLPDDDAELPGDVAAQFAILREEAPQAQQDLQDLFDEAARLDVTDKSAVRSYLQRMAMRAKSSDHVRRGLAAVEQLEGAELDEE